MPHAALPQLERAPLFLRRVALPEAISSCSAVRLLSYMVLLGPDKVEIVVPSVSVLAEPSVAVVKKNTDAKGTTAAATEYLQYLYSPEGQEIAAKHYYRPRDAAVAAKYAKQFPAIKLVDIESFGGWDKVQPEHFGDGGIFDQIYQR